MILHKPFGISSRLLPALGIGHAEISLEYAGTTGSGRTRYRYTIDLPDDTTHTGDDLKSGVGGGSLQEGFASLLAFLEAAAESYRYQLHTGRQGENVDLFPAAVVAWAYQHSDEIGMLRWAIEESGHPLIQESEVES